MLILIERPTKDDPEYKAWCSDCPCGSVLGTGKTIDEAKSDLENSLSEVLEEFERIDNKDALAKLKEYHKEERLYYIALDSDSHY